MKRTYSCLLAFSLLTFPLLSQDVGKVFPSEKRILTDSITGRRITALTTSPANDSKIYQTHPQWTADGKYIVFRSNRGKDGRTQAFAVQEESGEIIQLTDDPEVQTGSLNVSRKQNKLYFLRANQLIELDIDMILKDSRAGKMKKPERYERIVAKLPEGSRESGGFTMDALETYAYIGLRWEENGAEKWGIRKINITTGQVDPVVDLPFRVGHMQANPWVPGEILYCHETGGDAPQRMFLINADGSGNRPLYVETPDEWVSHEIWQDKDHVLFNLIAHLPRLRKKPAGIISINVRNDEVMLYDQAPGRGYWHCAGTSDLKWAVGDTFTGELHLINIVTGEVTLLSTHHYPRTENIPDVHSHHTISPDNTRVLFNSGLLGNQDIMIQTIP